MLSSSTYYHFDILLFRLFYSPEYSSSQKKYVPLEWFPLKISPFQIFSIYIILPLQIISSYRVYLSKATAMNWIYQFGIWVWYSGYVFTLFIYYWYLNLLFDFVIWLIWDMILVFKFDVLIFPFRLLHFYLLLIVSKV